MTKSVKKSLWVAGALLAIGAGDASLGIFGPAWWPTAMPTLFAIILSTLYTSVTSENDKNA